MTNIGDGDCVYSEGVGSGGVGGGSTSSTSSKSKKRKSSNADVSSLNTLEKKKVCISTIRISNIDAHQVCKSLRPNSSPFYINSTEGYNPDKSAELVQVGIQQRFAVTANSDKSKKYTLPFHI